METVIEFVVDLSGSMKDKIELTKQMLLSDIVPSLDYSSRIGIKSFSAVKDMPPVVQELPLQITDKEAIIAVINKLLFKNGGTPISDAIRQSIGTLKEYAASNKKIILVTDGQEDKGGDYISECKKAQTEGINCEIHVIGIGLDQVARAKAQEISKLTRGTYSDIPYKGGDVYNKTIISTGLSPFYSANLRIVSKPQIIEVAKPVSQIQEISKLVGEKTEPNVLESISVGNKVKKEESNIVLSEIVREIRQVRVELNQLREEKEQVADVIEDAELNESIRLISEKYLFDLLKNKYPNRVKWLNENGESNQDHDFEILEEDGTIEYYIECKGTAKQKQSFLVTKNEWKLFLNNTKNYQIYFIQNTFSNPSHIFINNVLDWLLKGKLLPYLKTRSIIKEDRVALTIADSQFV
ncbi:protein NO VEIN domain-containing protein [Hymenobacter koreensis]|uniref:VWFA domain-containing protein n=1 Tax=Hymenobacter koreensis TaxID=1084523 RepID=A0ABP8IU83_9BACT